MMKFLIIPLLAAHAFAASYSCSGGYYIVQADIVLSGSDTVDFGDTSTPCQVFGNGHKISGSTTGHVRMTRATVINLGGSQFTDDAINVTLSSSADLTFDRVTWDASGSIYLTITGAAAISIVDSTFQSNTIFPVVKDYGVSRALLQTQGNSTGAKGFKRNKVYRGWLESGADNWTIGGSSADGNIMAGYRVYIRNAANAGANWTVSYNYIRNLFPVTQDQNYWADVPGVDGVSATSTYSNNVISGQWVVRSVAGTLCDNVLFGVFGHQFVEGGSSGGVVCRNIMEQPWLGADQYGNTVPYAYNQSAVETQSAGTAYSAYSNTINGANAAAHGLLAMANGTTFPSFTNNAIYKLQTDSGHLAAFNMTSGTGTVTEDYNVIGWASGTPTKCGTGVTCTGGTHDVIAAPQFQGPVPLGFPFRDSDIFAGTVTVPMILNYYRYVYSPASVSNLRGAGSTGNDIGAVQYATRPATQAGNCTQSNCAPVVNSGRNYILTGGLTGYVDGFATDDNFDGSGTLTLQWSKVSGPGTITWGANSGACTTTPYCIMTATASTKGAYVLRLTATDGNSATGSADVAIVFNDYNSHPRVLLTSSLVTAMQTKVAGSDADWLTVKAAADAYAAKSAPSVTISTCSNAATMRCTSSGTLPFTGTATCYFGGATGAWASLNAPIYTSRSCTFVDSTHFDVNIDSSAFGAYTGQAAKVWIRDSLGAGYFTYDYEGTEWYNALVNLAAANKATGTASYCTAALGLLDYINTISAAGILSPITIDSGFPSRLIPFGVAIAYDWCYSSLTSGQKSATAVTLNLWHDWTRYNGFLASGRPDDNYWGGHLLGNALGAYATVSDNARASELIDYWRAEWNASLADATTTPADGTAYYPSGSLVSGYPVESYSYGVNTLVRFTQYMLAAQTAANETLLATSGLPDLFLTGLVYNTMPDRVGTTREGDWPGSETVLNLNLPLLLSYTQAGTTTGQYAEWYYQNRGTPPGGSSNQLADTAWTRFIYYDSTRTATDPGSALNVSAYQPGNNRFVWRSDWTTSALYSSFVANPSSNTANNGSHANRVAGNIDIARGADHLIIPAGQWKGTAGFLEPPNTFNGTNDFWNTLYFDDGASGYCFDGASYAGCQGLWGKIYAPIRYKVGQSAYQYALSELTRAYEMNGSTGAWSARTLRYWFREFLSLGGGTFLVLDRSKATSSAYTQQIRWHLSPQGTPTITSGVASNAVGASKVFIKPLLPASPTFAIAQLNDGSSNPFTYYAALSNGTPDTDLVALSLIYATSSAGSLPATTALAAASNWVAVQVADTTPRVAAIATSVTASGDNYSADTFTSTSFTSTHAGTGNYLVAGLTPGSGYSVVVGGSTILSGQTVDSSGTLYFTSTAGAVCVSNSGSCPATGGRASTKGVARIRGRAVLR